MTDKAIAKEIGDRFRELRLRKNISLETLSDHTLISVNTLKRLEKGSGKLDTMINVLRHLDALDQIESFLPPVTISPIEVIKLLGKKRQRASRNGAKEKNLSACVRKMNADGWEPW
ncbi:MAG: helix-turn-helix domain-containing protein [Methylobacter sp.]